MCKGTISCKALLSDIELFITNCRNYAQIRGKVLHTLRNFLFFFVYRWLGKFCRSVLQQAWYRCIWLHFYLPQVSYLCYLVLAAVLWFPKIFGISRNCLPKPCGDQHIITWWSKCSLHQGRFEQLIENW